MNKSEIDKWIEKEYPDGIIDWKKEYERISSVLEQAMPVIPKNLAQIKLLEIDLDVSKAIIEKYS